MAGRIPQAFINDLLSRIDIVDVIDPRVKLRKAGRNYQALCPFHNEKTPSFSVNPEKQFYYCFGCGATGTALTFLMEHEHLDFVSAVETLARQAGLEVPREQGLPGQAKGPDNTPLYAALDAAARYFRRALREHPEGARVIDYLKARGIQGVTVRDFGIGFAPPGWDGLRQALAEFPESDLVRAGLLVENEQGRRYDRFRDRLMFPIRDTRGRVIAFGGRVLGDGQPKYLNSPETPVFHKGRELYGLYEARRAVRRLERVLVVEGYMDVVALAQSGFPDVVATLGTASGREHFEKLFRLVPEVVCCFDGDAAGREAAWKALQVALPVLHEGRQLKFMFLPDGEDPDSLVHARGQAGFEAQLRDALTASEFLFQRLSRGLNLGSLDDRARLVSLAVPLLGEVPDGVFRSMLLSRLADLAQLPVAELRRGAGLDLAAAGKRPRGGVAQSQSSGTDAGVEPGGPAGPDAAGAGRQRQRGGGNALMAKLLALAVQYPDFVRSLDDRRLAGLLGAGDSLPVQVARFFVEQEGADTGALLGYWTGTPEHDALVAAANRRFELDATALQAEFIEAVDRFLAQLSKANRQRLVQELAEQGDGDLDLLARWQALMRARQP